MTPQQFLSDVAAISACGPSGSTFGSGRLIAPDLVLTAGHVVDYPTRQAPWLTGWTVSLLKNRCADGSWSAVGHPARLVWRADGELDLALLRIVSAAEVTPTVQPVFTAYDVTDPIAEVAAAGFPRAWHTASGGIQDYMLDGQLRNATQYGPYAWAVQPANRPDTSEGWQGMSGGAACKIESEGRLLLFGVLQSVPANFSGGLLKVARLSDAFSDDRFRRELHAMLGSVPPLVRWVGHETLRDIRRQATVGVALEAYIRAVANAARVPDYYIPGLTSGDDNDVLQFIAPNLIMNTSRELVQPRELLQRARSENRKLAILGNAGSGKSTLLRHYAANSWTHPESIGLQTPHVPIYLRLKSLANVSGFSIADRIERALEADRKLLMDDGKEPISIRTLLADPSVPHLLLLDGLDEVTSLEEKRWIMQFIREASQTVGGQQLVVTSRPERPDRPSDFDTTDYLAAVVCPFDWDRQKEMVSRTPGIDGRNLLAVIEGKDALLQLYSAPLLLAIALSVLRVGRGTIATSRIGVFRMLLQIWCEEWLRRGIREQLGDEISSIATDLLASLALAQLINSATAQERCAVEHLSAVMKEQLDLPFLRAQSTAKAFMSFMSYQSGALINLGEHLTWIHLSLQEFLAGLALANEVRSGASTLKSVANRWRSDRFKMSVIAFLTFLEGSDLLDQAVEVIHSANIRGDEFLATALAEGVQMPAGTRKRLAVSLREKAVSEFRRSPKTVFERCYRGIIFDDTDAIGGLVKPIFDPVFRQQVLILIGDPSADILLRTDTYHNVQPQLTQPEIDSLKTDCDTDDWIRLQSWDHIKRLNKEFLLELSKQYPSVIEHHPWIMETP